MGAMWHNICPLQLCISMEKLLSSQSFTNHSTPNNLPILLYAIKSVFSIS